MKNDNFKLIKKLVEENGWIKSLDKQSEQVEKIKDNYKKHGLVLVLTCGACPEQYEVFKDGVQVAYYRLRHGYFRVDVPNNLGETIYDTEPNGDGMFNDEERVKYMNIALNKLLENLTK